MLKHAVADCISRSARALLDKARPILGDPTDISFNGYNKTICLHWTATDTAVEVEVSETEFELYRFVNPTQISHWPCDKLDEFVSQLSNASQ